MPDAVTLQESAGPPKSAAAAESAAPMTSGGHVVDLTSAPSPAQPHRNVARSPEVLQDSASSTTSRRQSATRKVKVRALRRRRGRRAVESEGEGSSDEESKGAPSITDNSDESEDEDDDDSDEGDEGESSNDSDEEVHDVETEDAIRPGAVPASSSSVNLSATLASNGTAPTSPANTSTAASKESIEPSKWSDVMDQEDQVRSPSVQPPSAQQNALPSSKRARQRQATRERAAASKVAASNGRSAPSPTTPSTANGRGPTASPNPAGPAPRTGGPLRQNVRPPRGPKPTNASARPPSAPHTQRGSGARGGNSHVKGSGMARRGLMSWGSDDDVLEGGVEETPNAAVANSASASESIVRLPPSAPRALRKKEAEKRSVQTAASEPLTTATSQTTSAQASALEVPDSSASAKWGHEGFQELLAAGDRRARGRGRNGRGRGHAAIPGHSASSSRPPPGTPTGPSSQREIPAAEPANFIAPSADDNPREAAQALVLQEEDSGVRVRVPPTSRSVQVPVATENHPHSPAPLGMPPVTAPSPLPFGHSPLASPAIRSLPPGFIMDATGYVYDCNSGTPVAVGFVPPIVPPQPEQTHSGTTFYYQQSWPQQPAPAPYSRQVDDARRLVEPVRVRTPNAIPIKAARAAAFQPVKKVVAAQPLAGAAQSSGPEAAPDISAPSQSGSVSPSTARLSYGERVQLMRQQREHEQTEQQAQAQDTQQGHRQTQAAQRSIQVGPYESPNVDGHYRSYITADTQQPGYYSGYTDPSQYGGGYNPYAVQAHYAAYASGMAQGGQQSPVPGMYPGGGAYGAEVQQQAYLRDWSRQQEAQAQSYQLATQSHMGPQNGQNG